MRKKLALGALVAAILIAAIGAFVSATQSVYAGDRDPATQDKTKYGLVHPELGF